MAMFSGRIPVPVENCLNFSSRSGPRSALLPATENKPHPALLTLTTWAAQGRTRLWRLDLTVELVDDGGVALVRLDGVSQRVLVVLHLHQQHVVLTAPVWRRSRTVFFFLQRPDVAKKTGLFIVRAEQVNEIYINLQISFPNSSCQQNTIFLLVHNVIDNMINNSRWKALR